MPLHGGLTPGRERYGGAVPRIESILDSLNEQMGTAYDVTKTSPVYIRNLAIARMLADVWDANERLGNQFDPQRMTDFLPRWEAILGIIPSPTATEPERRRVVAHRFARIGVSPTHQAVTDELVFVLGPIPFTVELTDTASATKVWPPEMGETQSFGTTPPHVLVSGTPADERVRIDIVVGGALGVATFRLSTDGGLTYGATLTTAATYPIPGTGLTAEFFGGTYNADNSYRADAHPNDWSSTVAYVAIACTKPDAMTDAEFYDRMGAIFTALDPFVPAWLEFDWVRDGTNGIGFYLDEDNNLDNQRFD